MPDFGLQVPLDVCGLLRHFDLLGRSSVRYDNATDGYSIYIALTIAGVTGAIAILFGVF